MLDDSLCIFLVSEAFIWAEDAGVGCFALVPKRCAHRYTQVSAGSSLQQSLTWRQARNRPIGRPSRFLLEPLPAAPALPPSMAVVKPGRSNWQRSEQARPFERSNRPRPAWFESVSVNRSASFACACRLRLHSSGRLYMMSAVRGNEAKKDLLW